MSFTVDLPIDNSEAISRGFFLSHELGFADVEPCLCSHDLL